MDKQQSLFVTMALFRSLDRSAVDSVVGGEAESVFGDWAS